MPEYLIKPEADTDLSNAVVVSGTDPVTLSAAQVQRGTPLQVYHLTPATSTLTFPALSAPAQMGAPSLAVNSTTQITATLASDPATGGSAITSRDIRYRTGSGSWTTLTGVTSPRAITGLTASTAYEVQARAVNAVGAGAWSVSASATTSTPAQRVTITTVTAVDDGSGGLDVNIAATGAVNGDTGTYALTPAAGGAPVATGALTWPVTSLTLDPAPTDGNYTLTVSIADSGNVTSGVFAIEAPVAPVVPTSMRALPAPVPMRGNVTGSPTHLFTASGLVEGNTLYITVLAFSPGASPGALANSAAMTQVGTMQTGTYGARFFVFKAPISAAMASSGQISVNLTDFSGIAYVVGFETSIAATSETILFDTARSNVPTTLTISGTIATGGALFGTLFGDGLPETPADTSDVVVSGTTPAVISYPRTDEEVIQFAETTAGATTINFDMAAAGDNAQHVIGVLLS